jgi:hypothetical protein
MASLHRTDLYDDIDENLYHEHASKCWQNFIAQSAANSARPWRLHLLASNGLDCTQHRSFPFRVGQAWRHNIIVYIAHSEVRHDIALLALAYEFHKAVPTLLLQARLPFLRCEWSEAKLCPPKDLDEQALKTFIRNHLSLCDCVEAEALARPKSYDDLEDIDQRSLPPTQRAVTMLF